MKKCALILGLILLSQGIVFARCHETYGHHNYCKPHRIRGYNNYRIYYPMTGVSVNIGGGYHSMSPVMRSIYYPPRRNRGNISVHVSI